MCIIWYIYYPYILYIIDININWVIQVGKSSLVFYQKQPWLFKVQEYHFLATSWRKSFSPLQLSTYYLSRSSSQGLKSYVLSLQCFANIFFLYSNFFCFLWQSAFGSPFSSIPSLLAPKENRAKQSDLVSSIHQRMILDRGSTHWFAVNTLLLSGKDWTSSEVLLPFPHSPRIMFLVEVYWLVQWVLFIK